MSKCKKYAVIILAAGLSSRMGVFKPLLKCGSETALVRLIKSSKLAGIDEIIVVTGNQSHLIMPIIEAEEVRSIFNSQFEEGMFTSIKTGVAEIDKEIDAFFVMPVDYPLITAQVFIELIQKFEENPNSIIIPCFMGKKGHPPLLPKDLISEIIVHTGENGLKNIMNRNEERIIRLDLDFEEIVMDMDTKSDYENLVEHFKSMQTPEDERCLKMLEKFETPGEVRKHCIGVANLSTKIASELNEHGANLNVELIRSASLLHDIVRSQPKHDKVGARVARQYGLEEVANLIENHMFYLKEKHDSKVTEQDILCLADKMMNGDKFVSLRDRQKPRLEKFKGNIEAIENITNRFNRASELETHIKNITGKSVREISEQNQEEEKPKSQRRIFIIRHGETERHKEKIFLGQTDVPLSPEGIKQIQETAKKLAEYSPNAGRIYCSKLSRSVESAKLISEELYEGRSLTIEPIEEFAEMNLGAWDGMFISQVKEQFPKEYDNRGNNLLTYKIDQNAENYYDLRYRVITRLKKLMAEEKDKDIIIVAHAGVNSAIRSYLEDMDYYEVIIMRQDYGSTHIIDL